MAYVNVNRIGPISITFLDNHINVLFVFVPSSVEMSTDYFFLN